MTDRIIAGGTIYPSAGHRYAVEALLVRSGRVVMASTLADVRRHAAAGATEVDLNGGAAYPGFADSHLHLLWYGLLLDELNLFEIRSIGQLQATVGERAAASAADSWITGHGWQQENLAEQRMPTAADLDAVCGDRPVLLRRACAHIAVASSAALRRAGLGPDSPDPPGGELHRAPDGTLTGVLRERAIELVMACIPTPTDAMRRRALTRAAELALAAGLTAVHSDDLRQAVSLPEMLALYRDVFAEQNIALRVDEHIAWDHVAEAADNGWRTGADFGTVPGRLRIGGAKLFSDGSLGGRTAALRAPYTDDPATSGLLIMPPEELARHAAAAASMQFQPVVHAIGDLGAEVTLDAFAAALAAVPGQDDMHVAVRRPRLVHAQVYGADLIERSRNLGIVAEIQPKFVTGDMKFTEARIGADRLSHAYAWRSLLAAGVACAGGSDCPIEPLDPLLGIWAAVCRQDMDGAPTEGWLPDERLSLGQALRLFTEGVAFANGTEQQRGRLAPGYVADLTVLDRDLWEIEPAQLRDAQVKQTIIDGGVAWAK